MAKKGGSATLYGVLYQILGSIHWASVYFKGFRESDDLVSAQLVFEPADGGDFQVESATERIVQQWKSRSSGKPWTMRLIVQEVLPDLIRAVDLSRVDKPCAYQFLTEGRCSDSSAARDLFVWMREQGCPDNPLHAIESAPFNTDRFYSSRGTEISPTKFFNEIVLELRTRTRKPDLSPRAVWHLLANLEIRPEILAVEVRAKVDDFIKGQTHSPDDIALVRGRLCNLVLDLASQSGRALTPKEFFRMAELDTISLDTWRTVFGRLNGVTAERTYDLFQFDSRYNVRPRPDRLDDVPILFLTGHDEQGSPGESGKGKSFALGAIGNAEIGASRVVHAGRATGTAPEMLQTVSDYIWKTGFERTTNMTLDALAITLRKTCSGLSEPWLVVLLDDLHSPEDMRRLTDFPWRDSGALLVASTTLDIAAAARQEFPDLVRVIELPDFTPLELKEYLRRRDIRWGGVPPDVRAFLRWPILAQLYCDKAQANWEPENEYALFQGVWDRIRTDIRQISFPDDQPNLVEIIWDTLCDVCRYPWELTACRHHGLDSDAVSRLVNLGWLIREKGRIRIRHHRLLNWAVAEALATAFERNREGNLERIREVVGKEDERSAKFEGAHLGYVAMDLLWLVCDKDFSRVGDASLVLDVVIEGRSHINSDNLYRELLPTLGERIISPLVRNLESKQASQFTPWIYRTSRALRQVGKRFPEQVTAEGIAMLGHAELSVSACGTKILKRFHSSSALNGLWLLLWRYRDWKKTASSEDKTLSPVVDGDIQQALYHCAQLNPKWIEDAVQKAGGNLEALEELAQILSRIDGQVGETVWHVTRDALRALLETRSVGMAKCIDRFRDDDKYHVLKEWMIAGSDSCQAAAIQGMSAIDPIWFRSHVSKVDVHEIFFNAQNWAPRLLLDDRSSTIETFSGLMIGTPKRAYEHAYTLRDWIDVLSDNALKTLLNGLSKAIDDDAVNSTNESRSLISGICRLLARITEPRLREVLSAEAASPLQIKLTDVGIRWADEADDGQIKLDGVVKALLRFQGEGFTRVVNQMLSSKLRSRRLEGLDWSVHAPNAETRALLQKISTESNNSEAVDGAAIPNIRVLQDAATEKLAEVGADEGLIRALLFREQSIREMAELRGDFGPMNDTAYSAAVVALESGSQGEKELALKALGVTGRKDLIPTLLEHEHRAEADSPIGLAAICGLSGLYADSSDAIKAFARHLNVKGHGFIATNGLLGANNAEARSVLIDHLESSFQFDDNNADEQVAVILTKHPDTRARAFEVLKTKAPPRDAWHSAFQYSTPFDVYAELEDPEIQHVIDEEANPHEGNFHVTGRRASAIRATAKLDPQEAFDTALRALREGKHDRHFYPALMIEVDQEQAVRPLIDQFSVDRSELVCRAIGLALRKCKGHAVLTDVVNLWFDEGDANQRCAACAISGWIGPPFMYDKLCAVLRDDRIARVRQVAGRALHRFEQQETMARILKSMQDLNGLALWCSVDCLLQLDDAKFVGTHGDTLWIDPVYDHLGYARQRYLDDRYRKRLKEIESDLKRLGRD